MRLSAETPAIITGGASGLGAATVASLAALGVPVGILDRDVAQGEALAAQTGARFAACDVTDAASVRHALKALSDAQGVARVCVTCAGIAPSGRTVSKGQAHDTGLFQRVIDINLKGSFLVAAEAAAMMSAAEPIGADHERGIIILTSSIAAFEGQMGQAAYAASKAGVAGLVLPMARDLARSGVRVNAVAPGIFATPMVGAFPPDLQAALAEQAEFPKRLGEGEDFAALVRHIAENPMLNGTVIRLDAAARLRAR